VSDDFPELAALGQVLDQLGARARVRALAEVTHRGRRFPILAASIGSEAPSAPTLALIGGVHGLERIGTQVVLAYMQRVAVRLEWDATLRRDLAHVRLVFVPLVNPAGMWTERRSNPRGVDLMRNAPPHPESQASLLVGGHRLSPRLPWFAGWPEQAMETESGALCELVSSEVLEGSPAIVVDCHSGFGMIDRIWFPYARTRRPFPGLAEVVGLRRLLELTLPHHVYRIEPQAQGYTIAGDLWDHLYDVQRARFGDRAFVPLTLEMGSWLWVRKNPMQLFDRLGGFNPMKPHRLRRTLRRHLLLFDFLFRAVASADAWVPTDPSSRRALEEEGYRLWYSS
jgi:hypothetical protein